MRFDVQALRNAGKLFDSRSIDAEFIVLRPPLRLR